MSNGSLHMKGSNFRTPTTSINDQLIQASLIQNTDRDTSLDLTDVSILSVGLARYRNSNHEMLTDDDEDNECVRVKQLLKTKQR